MTRTSAIVHAGINRVELAATTVREPAAGEVLIKTEVSAISPGTELRCLAGREDPQPTFPYVPGQSLVGEVVATGPDEAFRIGERVHSRGTIDAGDLNIGWGAHVGLALCRAERVIAIPSDVPSEYAAVAKLAAFAHHGWRVTNPRPGATVGVVGLGVIGLCAALIHQARGSLVVGVDVLPERVELARRARLEAFVVDAAGAAHAIRRRFGGGVEIIVDATGSPTTFSDAVEALAPLPWDQQTHPSRIYVVQGSPAEPISLRTTQALSREMQMLFPRDTQRADYVAVLELVMRKQLDLSPLTCAVFKPSEAARVYQLLKDRQTASLTALFDWR